MKTGPLRGIASGLRWWRGVPLLCTQAGWVVAKNRLLGCPNLSLTSCLWLEFSKAPHSHLWNGEYLSLRSVGRTKQDKTHHGSFQSGSTVLGTQWGVQTVTLASWKSSSGAPWKQSDTVRSSAALPWPLLFLHRGIWYEQSSTLLNRLWPSLLVCVSLILNCFISVYLSLLWGSPLFCYNYLTPIEPKAHNK